MLRTLLFASTLLAAAGFATIANAEDTAMHPSISVSGHGEVRQRPDMAIVSAGVMSQAQQASAALDANTAAMTKVMATLKAAGIDEKFVQTSNFTVQAQYNYNDNDHPKFIGYQVQNMVTVSLHDLPQLGKVLDALVKSGANQINGITFDISDPAAAMDEARKRAVADAKHRADIYAAASGVTLAQVINISESGSSMPPPVPVRATFDKAAPSSDVPVAAGENVVAVDVNMAWALK